MNYLLYRCPIIATIGDPAVRDEKELKTHGGGGGQPVARRLAGLWFGESYRFDTESYRTDSEPYRLAGWDSPEEAWAWAGTRWQGSRRHRQNRSGDPLVLILVGGTDSLGSVGFGARPRTPRGGQGPAGKVAERTDKTGPGTPGFNLVGSTDSFRPAGCHPRGRLGTTRCRLGTTRCSFGTTRQALGRAASRRSTEVLRFHFSCSSRTRSRSRGSEGTRSSRSWTTSASTATRTTSGAAAT